MQLLLHLFEPADIIQRDARLDELTEDDLFRSVALIPLVQQLLSGIGHRQHRVVASDRHRTPHVGLGVVRDLGVFTFVLTPLVCVACGFQSACSLLVTDVPENENAKFDDVTSLGCARKQLLYVRQRGPRLADVQ